MTLVVGIASVGIEASTWSVRRLEILEDLRLTGKDNISLLNPRTSTYYTSSRQSHNPKTVTSDLWFCLSNTAKMVFQPS